MRGVALQSVEGIPLLGFRASKVPTRAVVPRCVTSYAARHGGTQPRLLSQAVQPPALRERHRQQPKRLLVSVAAEPTGWERTPGFHSQQHVPTRRLPLLSTSTLASGRAVAVSPTPFLSRTRTTWRTLTPAQPRLMIRTRGRTRWPLLRMSRRCHSPTTQAGSLRLRRRCPCRTVSYRVLRSHVAKHTFRGLTVTPLNGLDFD